MYSNWWIFRKWFLHSLTDSLFMPKIRLLSNKWLFNILTNFLNGLNNFVGNSGKCSQRQISPGSPVSDRFIHAGGVARGYVILTGSKKIKGGWESHPRVRNTDRVKENQGGDEKVTQGYVILTGPMNQGGWESHPRVRNTDRAKESKGGERESPKGT